MFTNFYRTQLGPILLDLEKIKKLAALKIPLRIADIGCGEGESTQSLARTFDNSTVVGIDIDRDALHAAKLNNTNINVRFVKADIIEMETTERFEVVCLFTCLHCMPYPTKGPFG